MQPDASNAGQPFYVASTDTGAGADAYGTGWAYEGAAGDDGIGLFTIPENAPNTLYYQSGTLAGMGAQLTIIDTPSPSVTIAGRLTNSGQVELPGSTLTLQNGADLTGGDLNLGDGKLVMEGSLIKTGGTINTTEATLKLEENISITSNDELIFKELDLNRFTLSLGSATSNLTVSNAVTMDDPGDQINAGYATLTLTGGLTLSGGTLATDDGTISLGNVSTVIAEGILDASGGTLELNAGLSVTGTLKTDSNTLLTLNNNALDLSGGQAATGGVLEASGMLNLDGITLDDKSTIKINADTTITSATPLTVKTVDLGTHFLMLGSETTALTIADSITINYPGPNGLNSGDANLTLNGPVNVLEGGIMSSGGTVTFGTGSSGASFSEERSGMLLEDTTLVLQTALDLPYLQFSGTSSFQTNGNTLNLGVLEIGLDSELDLTNVATNSESELLLIGNSAITKTGDLVFKEIGLNGYTCLILQSIV